FLRGFFHAGDGRMPSINRPEESFPTHRKVICWEQRAHVPDVVWTALRGGEPGGGGFSSSHEGLPGFHGFCHDQNGRGCEGALVDGSENKAPKSNKFRRGLE